MFLGLRGFYESNVDGTNVVRESNVTKDFDVNVGKDDSTVARN